MLLRGRPPRLPGPPAPTGQAQRRSSRADGSAGPDHVESSRGRAESSRGRAGLARTGRRRVARRRRLRRWAAALLAAGAGFVGVTAITPRGVAAPGVPTVVAARDVAAGAVLRADDLLVEPRPPGQRPETALTDPDDLVGQSLATALTAREVVTPARLRGAGMLAGQPDGTVAMSVPVLDPQAAGVTSGSRIDLYASGSGDRVAADVTVLATRVPEPSTWSAGGAASITLALDPASASTVARSVSTLQAGEIFVVALRSR